jgi:hypothetical protein
MLISLTNANETHRGNALLLNTDMMLSVYRNTKISEDNIVEDITYIFMPPHGTWEVAETPEQIASLINGKKPSVKIRT